MNGLMGIANEGQGGLNNFMDGNGNRCPFISTMNGGTVKEEQRITG